MDCELEYDKDRYTPYPVCNICGVEIDEDERVICDSCTKPVKEED